MLKIIHILNLIKELKDPKLKVGDYVRISKYKNFFTKGYVPNWSENVFIIKSSSIDICY